MDVAAAIIQVLLAVVFVGSGASKLAGVQMQVANFERYHYPQWFRLVTGAVEVIGAAGMVAGLFVDEIAVAAGLWLGVTMVVAMVTDIRYSPPPTFIAPLVLLALSIAVIALRLAE